MKIIPATHGPHSAHSTPHSIDVHSKAHSKAPTMQTSDDPGPMKKTTHGRDRPLHDVHRPPMQTTNADVKPQTSPEGPSTPQYTAYSTLPPLQTSYTNSPSQRVGDELERTWGDGCLCCGEPFPLQAHGSGIYVLRLDHRPMLIQTLIAIRRSLECRTPKLWPYARAGRQTSDPSACYGDPHADHGDHCLESSTETRNSSGADTGYIPFSPSDLRATVKGGPANPPQFFAGSEAGSPTPVGGDGALAPEEVA